MFPLDSISRIFEYQKRHGFQATVRRAWLAGKRKLTGGRMALFYCDLNSWKPEGGEFTSVITVERKNRKSEVAPADLDRIIQSWNPNIMKRLITERFDRGATLWLARTGDALAGYGWTLNGDTIEPHFFPLGSQDVHFFDFFVFPEFRGRRINVALVHHVLAALAAENRSRAFIEAADWNSPQLRSLSKMPFHSMGYARKFRFFGRSLVIWSTPPAFLAKTNKVMAAEQNQPTTAAGSLSGVKE